MSDFVLLETARLRLRPLRADDAPAIQRYAGDARVAVTTARIPHPYPDGAAEAWIAEAANQMAEDRGWQLAIARRSDDALIGAIGLERDEVGGSAELGYWIAVPAWGHGYATEAARALAGFGFARGGLAQIHAHALVDNLASRRVLEKIGLAYQGLATVEARGRNVTVACYALERAAWVARA